MCMGYAKEIKAWVCQTEQNQRDEAMVAWGEAFTQDTTSEKAPEMPSVKESMSSGKPFTAFLGGIRSAIG